MTAFWGVAQCGLEVDRRFRDATALMMEAVLSFGMSVHFETAICSNKLIDDQICVVM
jgi:hypothetical protein